MFISGAKKGKLNVRSIPGGKKGGKLTSDSGWNVEDIFNNFNISRVYLKVF